MPHQAQLASIFQAAHPLFPKASRFREAATLSLALQHLPLLTPRRKMKMLIPATASQRNSLFIAMMSRLEDAHALLNS
jgi:hypothetical protein